MKKTMIDGGHLRFQEIEYLDHDETNNLNAHSLHGKAFGKTVEFALSDSH